MNKIEPIAHRAEWTASGHVEQYQHAQPATFFGVHQRFDNHVAGDNETETSLFSLFYGLPAQYADDVIADKLTTAAD